jgi:hypothetical protein
VHLGTTGRSGELVTELEVVELCVCCECEQLGLHQQSCSPEREWNLPELLLWLDFTFFVFFLLPLD